MRSVLAVDTAAADTSLLTVAERRAAAGLLAADTSRDADLLAMDLRNSANICSECNIRVAGASEPTLRQEILIETFRVGSVGQLLLGRRHNVEIVSFDMDGTALTGADYIIDPEAGMLHRLIDDDIRYWCGSKLTIKYKAGFVTVPNDLKSAAIDYLRLSWLDQARDPLVKSEEIEIQDVDRVKRDYWIGAVPGQTSEGAVPAIVAGQLKRFRNALI
jgi:hypothetical protein